MAVCTHRHVLTSAVGSQTSWCLPAAPAPPATVQPRTHRTGTGCTFRWCSCWSQAAPHAEVQVLGCTRGSADWAEEDWQRLPACKTRGRQCRCVPATVPCMSGSSQPERSAPPPSAHATSRSRVKMM
eukprot:358413-Chlamydomonas_euryale.AAC.20